MASFDRPGDFRGPVIEYGIRKSTTSKSVGVNLLCLANEIFNHETGEWEPWDYDMRGFGTIWIIGKNGDTNEDAVKNAVESVDWDCSWTSISSKTWKPTDCSFSVVEKEYKGKVSFEISFINPYDRVPGNGMKQLDPDEVKALQQQYGTPLKALGAQFRRNKTAPPAGSKPAAPPPAKRQPEPVANGAPQEDIPF